MAPTAGALYRAGRGTLASPCRCSWLSLGTASVGPVALAGGSVGWGQSRAGAPATEAVRPPETQSQPVTPGSCTDKEQRKQACGQAARVPGRWHCAPDVRPAGPGDACPASIGD